MPERLSSGDARKGGESLEQRGVSASIDRTRADKSLSFPMSGWYVKFRNRVTARRNCVLTLVLCTSGGKVASSKRRKRSIRMKYSVVEIRKRQISRVAIKTASFARDRSTPGSIACFMAFHANLGILGGPRQTLRHKDPPPPNRQSSAIVQADDFNCAEHWGNSRLAMAGKEV